MSVELMWQSGTGNKASHECTMRRGMETSKITKQLNDGPGIWEINVKRGDKKNLWESS